MADKDVNPAEQAAEEAWSQLQSCLDKSLGFVFEAGAGAGKTFSLIRALQYIIERDGVSLLRKHQRVACITYTNVATNEIETRTDRHPSVYSSTIHSFCWSLIKSHQPFLRRELLNLSSWSERLKEALPVSLQSVEYNLGYPKIDESVIMLGHNDVIAIASTFIANAKFRHLLVNRFPVIFIDEYQDTDADFIAALSKYVIGDEKAPLLGFFGDHWQKIYGSGCGHIDNPKLSRIGKKANFRSVPAIVDFLNRLRPELPQDVQDPNAVGEVTVYHSNGWKGSRRTGGHWNGDLPETEAHACLEDVKTRLAQNGWDFSPENSKILMLTHSILASEQGYKALADCFSRNESFIKKEDSHITFLIDTVEPVLHAYAERRYGDMLAYLGGRNPAIRSHHDKAEWTQQLNGLLKVSSDGTIGSVMDFILKGRKFPVPEDVIKRERELAGRPEPLNPDQPDQIERLRMLRKVPYIQIPALAQFIDEKTPFSTKHGVKGAEFENVLVVFGRGWAQYNFAQFLEWLEKQRIPAAKADAYERNRNLFYVACSRPKRRLALLFTQELSSEALSALQQLFCDNAIHSLI